MKEDRRLCKMGICVDGHRGSPYESQLGSLQPPTSTFRLRFFGSDAEEDVEERWEVVMREVVRVEEDVGWDGLGIIRRLQV